jgi:hypothetical protein
VASSWSDGVPWCCVVRVCAVLRAIHCRSLSTGLAEGANPDTGVGRLFGRGGAGADRGGDEEMAAEGSEHSVQASGEPHRLQGGEHEGGHGVRLRAGLRVRGHLRCGLPAELGLSEADGPAF